MTPTTLTSGDVTTLPYGIIYCAINKINGKRYIGQTTKTLRHRRGRHIEQANAGKKLHRFQFAIRKYGIDAFDFIQLATASSAQELNELEERYVREYDTTHFAKGYNSVIPNVKIDYGKIAQDNRGRIPPNKGKSPSLATLKKVLKANLGTRFKDGHSCLPEWRAKVSQVNRGQHRSRSTEFPSSSIQCVETGEIYPTVSSAALKLGISHTNFAGYWRGKRKSVGGYQWVKITTDSGVSS